MAFEIPTMSESPLRRIRDRARGPATLINDGCRITGQIGGTGDVHVSGHVEGDCDIEGTVTLARIGSWSGTIKAGNIVVAGRVEGDIVSAGHVEITDTARITGTVTGDAIAVAEGAVVEGVMKTTGKNEPQEFVEKRSGD